MLHICWSVLFLTFDWPLCNMLSRAFIQAVGYSHRSSKCGVCVIHVASTRLSSIEVVWNETFGCGKKRKLCNWMHMFERQRLRDSIRPIFTTVLERLVTNSGIVMAGDGWLQAPSSPLTLTMVSPHRLCYFISYSADFEFQFSLHSDVNTAYVG